MNAIPRSARLSSPGEVVAILVGSGVISILMLAGVFALFVTVLIPAFELGGKAQIPSDLPVYPGAKLEHAFANGFGSCTNLDAAWSTPASASDVTDFYKSQLNTGAWTLTDTSPVRGGSDLSFTSSSGPHREGVITVSRTAGGGSEISLEFTESIPSESRVSDCHIIVGRTG
jgi:hypothetical protein